MPTFALIATFLLLSSLFAVAATPLVNNSSINYSLSPNQITINGSGFSPQGRSPTVLFNNATLSLVSFTDLQIVAGLPSGTSAGTYRLRVINSHIWVSAVDAGQVTELASNGVIIGQFNIGPSPSGLAFDWRQYLGHRLDQQHCYQVEGRI
jgi:hypothetical protein